MTDENSKLLEQYQKILKMCTKHMKKCSKFEEQLIRDLKMNEKNMYGFCRSIPSQITLAGDYYAS